MTLVQWMHWYWASFLLIGFLVPESVMIISGNYKGTLSDTVWDWCDVVPGQTFLQWGLLRFILAAFMLGLTAHLVFGTLTRFK